MGIFSQGSWALAELLHPLFAPLLPGAPARSRPRLLVFIVALTVLGTVGRFRLVDADEGYYLYAGRLVLEGRVPYRDFFYPQALLLPYLYAGWMKLTGVGWLSGRALPCLAGALTAVLVHGRATGESRSRAAGALAVFLYLASGLIIGWQPVAKTYALSTLLLFGAHCLAAGRRAHPFAAGLALGLAGDVRIFFLAAAPFVWLPLRQRRRATLAFALGTALAVAPLVWSFAAGPESFWFDNLGYHALRSDAGFIGGGFPKLWVVFDLVVPLSASALQNLLLVALCVAGGQWRSPALVIAAALTFLHLLPTPSFPQYMTVVVPFVAVAAATGIAARPPAPAGRRRLVLLLAVYGMLLPVEMLRYCVSGSGVPGVERAVDWRIGTIRAVGKRLDGAAGPVLSFWPGYFLESTARPLPRTENHFGLAVAGRLTREARERLKLMSRPELEAHLAARTPALVVIGNWADQSDRGDWIRRTEAAGYRLVDSVATTRIYARQRGGE